MALTNSEQLELADIMVWALDELGTCADPNIPTEYCARVCRAKELICGEWPQSQPCQDLTDLADLRCGGCTS